MASIHCLFLCIKIDWILIFTSKFQESIEIRNCVYPQIPWYHLFCIRISPNGCFVTVTPSFTLIYAPVSSNVWNLKKGSNSGFYWDLAVLCQGIGLVFWPNVLLFSTNILVYFQIYFGLMWFMDSIMDPRISIYFSFEILIIANNSQHCNSSFCTGGTIKLHLHSSSCNNTSPVLLTVTIRHL